MKKILCFIAVLFILIGVTGCMNNNNKKNLNRKESDEEYSMLMQEYMEKKYETKFDVVENIFPREGFNTGEKENIVVLKDSQGIQANVKAKHSTPYKFYDDYVESFVASKIEKDIDKTLFENVKFYVTLKNKEINEVDISPNNVSSLTVIGRISKNTDENLYKELYDQYIQICEKRYDNIYFLIGFAPESEELDKAIDNYRIYGKSSWTEYDGDVKGFLKVMEPNVSYEKFISSIKK